MKPNKDYPKIAVAALIQRANDIAVACRRDTKELAGLENGDSEKLAVLAKKCSELAAECGIQKEKTVEETARMAAYINECRKLRGEVAQNLRRAFSLNGVKIPIPAFRGYRSMPQLVQDLNDIAVFSRMHEPQLRDARFDFPLADSAARAAKELSEALAKAELIKTMPSKLIDERNAVCRELYESAMKICGKARETFKNDPLRRKDYRSIQFS